jgi:hypothetical protein
MGAGTVVLTDEKPRLVDGDLLWQEKEAICSKYNDPQAAIPCKAVEVSAESSLVLSLHREICATQYAEWTLRRSRRFGSGKSKPH